MTSFLKLAGGIAFVVAAATGTATAANAQEKITYNMSWLPQGSSVGPIVAAEKGWFKKEGLDVAIIRGYGGNRTANELDQGQFEVGYVDPISLALNRMNGGKIRLIGAINTQWPAGICYLPSRHHIKTLNDLRGLTMGGGSASPVQEMVPAWLELNGKPKDFIHMLRMDPAVINSALIQGKIALAECWQGSNRAVILKLAKAAGVKVAWVQYSNYKLNAYGSGFAARDEYIAKKPEVLRKFLRASYRGYKFAISKPDEAADLMIKMFPTLDRSVALAQIHGINDLIVDKSATDKELGYFRKDRIDSTVVFIDKAFGLKGKVKPQDIYTDALLGK